MKTVRIQRNGETLASVWHATGYFARLRGLLGRTIPPEGGLLLTPCNAIHMIGMRYAIDATKIEHELGWIPKTNFDKGIKATIKWYLENETWWRNVLDGSYREYYERMYANR